MRLRLIRVELPFHLRTLARVDRDVTVEVEGPATLRSVLDVYRQGGVSFDNIDPEIHTLNMPEFEFEQLLTFVQNGLTDPRAAAELPPFDRPRLASEE
jgi:hypothetical protein